MTIITSVIRGSDLSPAAIKAIGKALSEHEFLSTPENLYQYAQMMYDTGDESYYADVFEALTKAAEKDHPDATNLLGRFYLKGYGVEKDEKKAMELFLRSAELGSLDGHFSVGNEYLYGRIVERDYALAYEHLMIGVKDGDDRALNSMGIMYIYGYHVKRNLRKARRLFKKAAKMGNESAGLNLLLMDAFKGDFESFEYDMIPLRKKSEDGDGS